MKILKHDVYSWDAVDAMQCPYCDDEDDIGYLQVTGFRIENSLEPELKVEGECGHSFVLYFEFHKGNTLLRAKPLRTKS